MLPIANRPPRPQTMARALCLGLCLLTLLPQTWLMKTPGGHGPLPHLPKQDTLPSSASEPRSSQHVPLPVTFPPPLTQTTVLSALSPGPGLLRPQGRLMESRTRSRVGVRAETSRGLDPDRPKNYGHRRKDLGGDLREGEGRAAANTRCFPPTWQSRWSLQRASLRVLETHTV